MVNRHSDWEGNQNQREDGGQRLQGQEAVRQFGKAYLLVWDLALQEKSFGGGLSEAEVQIP